MRQSIDSRLERLEAKVTPKGPPPAHVFQLPKGMTEAEAQAIYEKETGRKVQPGDRVYHLVIVDPPKWKDRVW